MIPRLTTLIGYTEGISALCLFFIAMPMKYFFGQPEVVTVVGSLHGGLFVAYIVILMAGVGGHWNKLAVLHGFIAASIPFGPFWFDGKLKAGKYAL
ncbi:MAG TPA: DUF3817 domain-containing protein [Candidatus Poseidoniaceae archaeon]|nr:MAG TPA: DUF3817 domain-containing protein [Candidatus Poseidoniales archaeon]HII45030.1 DUF3817 domain-containing protein [Candidatus Poseidoniaceae archaeon]|tara:strand:- start:1685 stop:1972 length:288 start_codon:yes stop_codon:yes gene_type:complete